MTESAERQHRAAPQHVCQAEPWLLTNKSKSSPHLLVYTDEDASIFEALTPSCGRNTELQVRLAEFFSGETWTKTNFGPERKVLYGWTSRTITVCCSSQRTCFRRSLPNKSHSMLGFVGQSFTAEKQLFVGVYIHVTHQQLNKTACDWDKTPTLSQLSSSEERHVQEGTSSKKAATPPIHQSHRHQGLAPPFILCATVNTNFWSESVVAL